MRHATAGDDYAAKHDIFSKVLTKPGLFSDYARHMPPTTCCRDTFQKQYMPLACRGAPPISPRRDAEKVLFISFHFRRCRLHIASYFICHTADARAYFTSGHDHRSARTRSKQITPDATSPRQKAPTTHTPALRHITLGHQCGN